MNFETKELGVLLGDRKGVRVAGCCRKRASRSLICQVDSYMGQLLCARHCGGAGGQGTCEPVQVGGAEELTRGDLLTAGCKEKAIYSARPVTSQGTAILRRGYSRCKCPEAT